MKKVLAVVLAIIMLFALSACREKESGQKPNEIRWPNTEMVNRLPKPDTLYGKVSWEYEDDFAVELIEISYEAYEDYVDACMDKGFTVDYSRDETSFYALDSEGYDLSIDYDEDVMTMSIYIEAPSDDDEDYVDVDDEEDEEETTTTTKKPTTTTTTKSKTDDNNIDPEFKEAMDAYEAFMDDYVEFMKKYQDNPTDLSLLADYAKFMSDYTDYSKEFAAWEDEDLNAAELEYYMDVLNRVNKKLLEVAE